jgi:hypothetical protein
MRCMTIRSRRLRRDRQRNRRFERPGVIDFPWDADPGSDGPRSDVTCEIPWRVDGFEAIQVYVDPSLAEQSEAICQTMEGLAGAHRDIDTLAQALLTFGSQEDLAVAIHEQVPEDLSTGVVAVAITLG